ncbi:hypothetical protein X777_07855 [Ooceraea biroi]|uniref:Uncharacterized protein n=1 Tax=Ooceraea biroi TaxID=2015173 RepID=A0A026WZR0_OOCBI|nr:hypothetical protein X777_07855 [Ooceraea biroi]
MFCPRAPNYSALCPFPPIGIAKEKKKKTKKTRKERKKELIPPTLLGPARGPARWLRRGGGVGGK